MTTPDQTVPYITTTDAEGIIDALQMRLFALNDLHLVLKHVHWNVTGPSFIAVHEMLDPQIEDVREMADALAERIAMLGGSPNGNAGALVAARTWDDYKLGRVSTQEHMVALDHVYINFNKDHHAAADIAADKGDDVSQGILLAQLEELDKYHWFIRSHLM
ncbi:MAG: DNA starvation/stationary phase protection protein [Cellulomonadaceae bacterium]|jgi:starvation-inducible DNA-binding protein|nr:DNA starvation/stationary phase protection protein [Cellulomonadaceae bacterium]